MPHSVELLPDVSSSSSPPATAELEAPSWKRHFQWLKLALVLVLLSFATYQKVWHAGFIWDDDAHVTKNAVIVGPLGVLDIWTSAAARICPLVLTSFWAEYHAFGLDPQPYHLVNVLVHALSAVVLWRVLVQLRAPGAWLGAALWAFHPVQVETVAWITELKNTQSCFFFLLSILYFIKYLQAGQHDLAERPRSGKYYGISVVFAALAMTSKSSAVVLPLVLALFAWWVQGGWRWRMSLRLIPFFIFSAMASLLSIWTQHLEGANEGLLIRTPLERLLTAGAVFWFYLGKLAWPHPLIFVYPRWELNTKDWMWYLPTLSALLVFGLLWWKRATWRSVFLTYVYFGVTLLPVLGILDHFFLRYSFVGDHFQYLASMGPLALLGVGMATAFQKLRLSSASQRLITGLLIVPMALHSWQRTAVYQSNTTLWQDTLEQNPNCYMAYNNLGNEEFARGEVNEAIDDWNKSIELWPENSDGLGNLGAAYLCIPGKLEEAIKYCQMAIKLSPQSFKARVNLGNAFYRKGQIKDALDQYREALHIAPRDFGALNNTAWILATSPDPKLRNGAEAMDLGKRAYALVGERPTLLRTLAAAHAATGDLAGANELANRALRINAGRNAPLAMGLRNDMLNYQPSRPTTEHVKLPNDGLPTAPAAQ